MNTKVRSHDEYLSFVCTQIESQNISKYFIRDFYFDTIIWTSLIDLTQTAELLKHRFIQLIQEVENHAIQMICFGACCLCTIKKLQVSINGFTL
ncbi:hypothetical protein ACA29_09765 [Lederbergia galactosidilytica]|uniref:Uncharacterized protein n=1 Tax=Lederbergia galactosidilytica TaxID=217031 RepID=A0A0Q9Y9I9_9BACI|nr:hypothetical protein ACA29_09765 [Lederbergia galactosidilytica]